MNEKCDSIQMIVSDGDKIQDTLNLKARKTIKSKRSSKPQTNLIKSLTGKTVAFFDTIWVGFNNPIKTVNQTDSAVLVMNLKDSSITRKPLRISNNRLKGWVEMELKQGGKYELTINKNMVKDIYGHGNDTLKFSTEVTTTAQYGNLTISIGKDSLKWDTPQVIIEVLNEQNVVVRKHVATGVEQIKFANMTPGKYNVRAIMDSNSNSKWDEGDYWQKLQPEKVAYFPKTLDIRANWDIEERW